MKSIQWRHTDWTTRKYVFQSGLDTVGKLILGNWNSSAVYLAGDSRIIFSERGFWSNTIQIKCNNELVATVDNRVFGVQTLKLKSGEVYRLKRKFFSQNMKWLNAEGVSVANYWQATRGSKGKGTLKFLQSLPEETEQLLTSSGLYLSIMLPKRIAVIMVGVLIPIYVASRY